MRLILVIMYLVIAAAAVAQECLPYDQYLQPGHRPLELADANCLAGSGQILYVGRDSGLAVYRVDVAGGIHELSSAVAGMSITELHVDDDWLCAIGELDGVGSLVLLDVRLPSGPEPRHRFTLPEGAVLQDIEQRRLWLFNQLPAASEPSVNGYTWNADGELRLDRVLDIPTDRRFGSIRFPYVFLILPSLTDFDYQTEVVEMWDYSTPENAMLMGEHAGWSEVSRIQIEADKVYVHAWRMGIGMICSTYTNDVYELGALGELELLSDSWGNYWDDESAWAHWGSDHRLQLFSDAETASIRPIEGSGEALVRLNGPTSSIAIAGGQWFLLDDLGVLVVDLNLPDALPTLGSWGTGGGTSHDPGESCWGLLVNEGIAYLGSTYGLAAIEIGADGLIHRLGYSSYGQPTAMALAGSTLYTSDWESAFNNTPYLYIYDVQDAAMPVNLTYFPLPHITGRLAVTRDTVYAASWEEGLLVIDVADPMSPQIVEHMLQGDLVRDVMVWDGHLIVAGVDLGIYSIDDPANPILETLVDTEAPIHHLHRSGDRLYVSMGEGGVRVFDFANPEMPQSLGHDPVTTFECATDGNTAYLRGHDLTIADVSDPSDFRRLAGHSHSGRWGQIEVTPGGLLVGLIAEPCLGHQALEMHPLHCGESPGLELELFTVTPGEHEVRMHWSTSTTIAGTDFRVLVEGEYGSSYSVATHAFGFGEYGATDSHADLELGGRLLYRLEARPPGDEWRVVAGDEVTLPTRIDAIRGAWPNPFNPTLTVRLFQDAQRYAFVAVHDVLGRRVAQLHDGPLPAGGTDLMWDGMDTSGEPVASGIYFIHYDGGVASDSRKVVLLR